MGERGARIGIVWIGTALAGLGLLASVVRSVRFERRVSRAIPPADRSMTIGSFRIEYRDEGSGPAIVLIHGLAGQMRNFTGALAGRLATDHRVISFDRPGSGHSTRRRDRDATLPIEAGVVAQLIDRLGLGRAVLMGHSFGGAVALQTAVDHPGKVAALALVAPLTRGGGRGLAPALWMFAIPNPVLRFGFAWTLAVPIGLAIGRFRLRELFGPEPPHPEFRTRFGGALTVRPSAYRAASADLMAARDGLRRLIARYGSVACPVGILYGAGDRILDPRRNGETALPLIAGSTLELVEGGHMLPVSNPALVERFVREVAGRERGKARQGALPLEPHRHASSMPPA